MNSHDIGTVDSQCRLLLPEEFANSTVAIERVGDGELRIRKVVVEEEELVEPEFHLKPLSDRDRDFFLNLLENPPEPTPALIAACMKYNARNDRA